MSGDAVHSLWTAAAVSATVVLALRAALLRRRSRAGHRRRAAVLGPPPGRPVHGRPPGRKRPVLVRRPAHEAAAALGAGALAFVLLGPGAGTPAAPAVAFGVWRWLRAHPADVGRTADAARERAVTAQLPLAAELLAACLAAGSTPRDAARAVGGCLAGPLGERLQRAGDELRLGADPGDAWARVGELPGSGQLARCLRRAHDSGAPAVTEVARVAAECRAASARAAAARARRAGVLVTGPLALCFLPAFLLAGVTPVVVGLGRSLL
ncbi:type II secretion system F family protein [Streptomyces sp. TRM 70351]|uniref:type II secretion system F family protein n=1 Tax=Streptomyces sp. TRM 70351 TaxID=3116552 RepID=UPI002E7B4EB1|nr:type II secretion system F family protein [Streptomyces sp. TRM 70351]MEE1930275.1 type II secretion system F family protein [Streptomyces sp. TRM 70351]